jgi:microsomal dipeptidase-like Zn-dependent dipeptidase
MTDRLDPDQSLFADQTMRSNNGQAELRMQGDGNLVLYSAAGAYLWDSQTDRHPGAHAIMQGDGNFVVYGSDGAPLWATATDGHPGAFLRLLDDGNLVVYASDGRPLWATTTSVGSARTRHVGFADLHNHQFAYLGFGGLAFHGKAFGPAPEALPWCDYLTPLIPRHGPGGVNDIMGNLMKAMYGGGWIPGHLVGGFPQFDGWPRWNSVTHQSVYADWLWRSVQGGLRLMVVLAVNSEFFCSLANRTLSCNDMEAVDRQLAEARKMEAAIDAAAGGEGKGWYRIVGSPDEAMAVMEAGKLAVVLGIEVDYLFNCRTPGGFEPRTVIEQLDKYFALGVRHVFPIHFANNGFGGTAFQNDLEYDPQLAPAEALVINGINVRAYPVVTEPAPEYEYRTGRRNVSGLTDLGKLLVREMLNRGMIVDVDHMSARSKADTFAIAASLGVPVVSGHTGFVDISHGKKKHEGQLKADEIETIRRLGGMVSVIPNQGDVDEIATTTGGPTVVPHACGHTSEGLVQAYLHAVATTGQPIGIGTDFNGFAGLPRPRFQPDGCYGPGSNAPRTRYPFVAAASGFTMDRSVVGQRAPFDVNTDGPAHVGLLPDLIAEFEALGLTRPDLGPLLDSASGYARVWRSATRQFQVGWRRCRKCQELVFSKSASQGACAAGGRHDTTGSADYRMARSGTWAGSQAGWRLCSKCQGLFFSGNPSQGVCPGRGMHDPTGSADYRLARTGGWSDDQAGWRWCMKCQGLFFLADATTAKCPAKGKHDETGSAEYHLVGPDLRDGALVREAATAPVYVMYGGAKFGIPDPQWLLKYGNWIAVREVPTGSLAPIPTIPREGTLLREWSSPSGYLIRNGQKSLIPSPVRFVELGLSWADVNPVPDHGLEHIPEGPNG